MEPRVHKPASRWCRLGEKIPLGEEMGEAATAEAGWAAVATAAATAEG